MANYNIDIGVVIKGNEKLTKFNSTLKKTTLQVEQLNKFLKVFQQGGDGLVRSFDSLNSVLATAKANFNAVASGTGLQEKAARQLILAEKELNREYQQRDALLQKLRGTGPMPLPGTGIGRDPIESSRRRKQRRLSQTLRGQSVPLTSPIFPGYSEPIGPQPMQGPMPMQGPLQMMTVDNNPRILRNITASQAARQGSNFGFGLAGDPIAKSIRRNKEKQFRDLLREKKANKDIRDIKARQLRLDRAQNRALKERVVTTRTLAKTSQSTGGGMGGRGLFRGGARGALSNAMIGGGFPLLFGQGALGAVGGGVGGALGGAIGGGFGFSLSIIGTAIAQRIQEAIDFRKEIEKVNIAIEKTGGTSKISAYDITSLSKSLKITKEEALQAANAFAAFGAQSALALAETFRDRSTFDLYANLNRDAKTFIGTVDTLFKKNELGIDQAQEALGILNQRGLKEASIFVESLKFQEKIKKEISEQVPLQKDINAAQATYESFFDKMSGRPLQSFMLLNKERQKEILLLITAKGQMEARIGTEEERFKKRMSNVLAEIEAQRELTKTIERELIIQQPKDELERLLDPLIQVDLLGKSIGASFSESFKGIVRGSMTAQDALRNLFMRTADYFLDMAAQILAAQIRSGIFGLFKNFLNPSPSFKITGGPSITTPSGTNIGKAGFMPSNPPIGPSVDLSKPDNYNQIRFGFGKAMGGPVTGGTSYIVGERGPELFTPGSSGMITPNHALGGSTNIVVNVDASGSNVEGDEEQGRELGRLISVAIQSELVQQKRPGGLLA